MLLHFSLFFVAAIMVNARPARDVGKFPCHKNLEIISDWPDGYRGILELPVLQKMTPLPDSMKGGHVIIKFNRSIDTLDVPQGDHSRRQVSSDGKEYRIFIKFTNELTSLKKGDIYSLDISVHHKRFLKGNIGIIGIKFADFLCPEPQVVEDVYPTCDKYIRMIDNTPPDGYRAKLMIPVNYTMNGWNLEIGFTKEILVLDVPQGIRTPASRNVKIFSIENREYNGFVKKGSTFRLEFMVHFDRNRFKKWGIKIEYIRLGLFECRAPWFTGSQED